MSSCCIVDIAYSCTKFDNFRFSRSSDMIGAQKFCNGQWRANPNRDWDLNRDLNTFWEWFDSLKIPFGSRRLGFDLIRYFCDSICAVRFDRRIIAGCYSPVLFRSEEESQIRPETVWSKVFPVRKQRKKLPKTFWKSPKSKIILWKLSRPKWARHKQVMSAFPSYRITEIESLALVARPLTLCRNAAELAIALKNSVLPVRVSRWTLVVTIGRSDRWCQMLTKLYVNCIN